MPITAAHLNAVETAKAAIEAAEAQHQAALQAIADQLAEGETRVLGNVPVPGVKKINGKAEFGDIQTLVEG